MYFTYVLKSKEYNKSYIGITDNLSRRLVQHNSGYSTYTKRYRPWYVVHKEEFDSRFVAHHRELFLKSAAGRRWLKKMVFNSADVAELVYAQP